PQLTTDSDGKVNVKFTINEAMTKWKLQLFAHTIDLKYGIDIKEIVTRKPIQVKPYYPRFFRQGDQIQLSTMVSNLSEENQDGNTQLIILDASSQSDISQEFLSKDQSKSFDLKPSTNVNIHWNVKIPKDETRTLIVRFIAQGTHHSDGEEMVIPVVSNRKLITETIALPIKGGQTKNFVFEALKKLSTNGSTPQQFSLEFSSHPVWYAVQVLPYIMEYPFDCNEQIMSRIFANSIGTHIMKKFPKVASTLKQMQGEGQSVSKLLQNQELKSALIEETTWILDAQSETEQMKRVALLMDFNNMNESFHSAVSKLSQRQNGDGSFSWFPGMYPDQFMTQHIVVQIAHLKRLNIEGDYMEELQNIAKKARGFLDYSIKKEYDELAKLVKEKKASWEDNHISSITIHYYYCKALYSDWNSDASMKIIDNYYLNQIENFWIKNGLYEQALCGIIASKNNKSNLAQLIVKSLKQRSLVSEELGRYWKNQWSYYWTQMPIETHALMIELFYDVAKDVNVVDELKTWLLKNKQTQHWGTTKSTSEAIYSILAFGENYTEENKFVSIELGTQKLDLSKSAAGSSYYKNNWYKSEIKPEFANIKISNPNKSIAWGAAYYQYFQNLDLVEQSNMKELILNKELYVKTNTIKGQVLKPITDLDKIHTGDIVTARIIINADRPMDYVHLKVMRAAGLEPIHQLSGYQYSGGIGYYLSPRDLATDFFISYLPKGTFVLEYDLRASFKGEFSDGVSSLQCMYAPEFAAHSKGIKINIE
ncbi:MAG: alpha-2-macroglobulin family protein, partial [Saprospiraceae bacterium]